MRKWCRVIGIYMLAACGQLEQGDSISEGPELGSEESQVLQCSFGCSAGFHPVAFSCNQSCPGSCTAVFNQTNCQPNTGSSFLSCSIGCPPPYRPVSTSFNPSCRTSPASGSSNNQTLCVL